MSAFLTNLLESIFTPGPTPSIVAATNASFAALQLLLFILLLATHSLHFLVLSVLSGGLWWAINWFVWELQAANEKEVKAKSLRDLKKEREATAAPDDSGTETEDPRVVTKPPRPEPSGASLKPASADETLRKRRSLGSVSGTDSEWDKVEDEGDVEA
jgi:hypothetical protein